MGKPIEFEQDSGWRKVSTSEMSADEIVQMLLEWYVRHDVFSGESIMQMDDPILDAPAMLSDMADRLLVVKYEEWE